MTVQVSTNYRRLSPDEIPALAAELADAWKDASIPMRQWVGVVRGEIERYLEGEAQPHFDVLIRALEQIPIHIPSLLDVGASSGFYSEIFRIAGFHCEYVALDHSEAYKQLAESLFPGIVFKVGDARELPYLANSFDVVLSGCCLLHIAEYEKVIAETARVASRYAIFNRTPVLSGVETTCYLKTGYGQPMIEWHFNDAELSELFWKYGLEVVSAEDVFSDPENNFCQRTFLAKKVS